MIFVTAFPSDRLRKQALDAGAFGFLSKPFDEVKPDHLHRQGAAAAVAELKRPRLTRRIAEILCWSMIFSENRRPLFRDHALYQRIGSLIGFDTKRLPTCNGIAQPRSLVSLAKREVGGDQCQTSSAHQASFPSSSDSLRRRGARARGRIRRRLRRQSRRWRRPPRLRTRPRRSRPRLMSAVRPAVSRLGPITQYLLPARRPPAGGRCPRRARHRRRRARAAPPVPPLNADRETQNACIIRSKALGGLWLSGPLLGRRLHHRRDQSPSAAARAAPADITAVNRVNKGDQIATTAVRQMQQKQVQEKQVQQQLSPSADNVKISLQRPPLGCDGAFSPVAEPARAGIYKRCTV